MIGTMMLAYLGRQHGPLATSDTITFMPLPLPKSMVDLLMPNEGKRRSYRVVAVDREAGTVTMKGDE